MATLASKLREASSVQSRAGRFTMRGPSAAFRVAASGASLFCALGVSMATAAESVDAVDAAGAFGQWQIVGVIVLVVLQGILITALLAERRARIKAVAGNLEQRAELAHGSRLAIVGQLYASIAHEINQPLGAILSNADAAEMMLRQSAPNIAEVRAILSDIRKDGLRASEVIRHVRTLARKRQVESVPLDLHAMCEDVLRLVAPDAERRGITIRAHFEPRVQIVRGDVVYLQQVMLNLVMNAMDALTGVPPARAIIEVRTSSPRQGEVEVSVRDHGNGVPEPHLHRLFDSFFSTKAHGLGLGLSVVRSIIETHGGHVVAENHPRGGALFRFTIPTVPAARETEVIAMRPARKTA
jgi:C4-dicarboxylate-specific signal transduction histidine kinase